MALTTAVLFVCSTGRLERNCYGRISFKHRAGTVRRHKHRERCGERLDAKGLRGVELSVYTVGGCSKAIIMCIVFSK